MFTWLSYSAPYIFNLVSDFSAVDPGEQLQNPWFAALLGWFHNGRPLRLPFMCTVFPDSIQHLWAARLIPSTHQMCWPFSCAYHLRHWVRFPCASGPTSLNKLVTVKSLMQSWSLRRWCTRQEPESLIGHLHHAAKVVWPGRAFLRCMIDLLCYFRKKDHPIRLNKEFLRDLQRWDLLLPQWHGVSSCGLRSGSRCCWLTGLWSLLQWPLVSGQLG